MENNFINVRDLLKQELARRCQRNTRYSLRAFANSLGLSSSFLSKLINGQRPLTGKVLDQISESLELSPQQVLALRHKIHGTELNQKAKNAMQFYQLKLDQFALISDWQHFAILELMTLPRPEFKADYFAKELSISPHEAQAAMDRLVRLSLIEKSKTGKWLLKTQNGSTVDSSTASAAAKKLQKQIIEKALAAVDDVPLEFRSQSAMTMAIPSSRMDEARELIKNFRRQFTEIMQSKGERDSVYQLSVSFFPLTSTTNLKSKTKKEKSK
ncbi:hypothetical protein D3C72_1272070 [compost metagenome]